MEVTLTPQDQEKKRKHKEQQRRKIKEERKNKLRESAVQKQLKTSKKSHSEMLEKKKQESYKEQLTQDMLSELNFAQKLSLIKSTSMEIIQNPDFAYRKLNDLLLCLKDPKDIDVVLKSLYYLADVFCDILPSYRIRENQDINKDGDGKNNKFVSKDVAQLREQEQFLLNAYKEYLKDLEVFSNIRTEKIIKKAGIEEQKEFKKAQAIYKKLRETSVICFCKLLKRHPHFNFRINILQIIMPKLATNDILIRNECTNTLFELLKSEEYQLLDFKLEILKELAKIIKTKPHNKMDPNLLDCIVSNLIIVDEEKAKAIDSSSKKIEDLHQQMTKLRKKGKFQDYKTMKQDLLKEMKESDAIGVDIGKSSKLNNLIIKEILSIYFDILKNKQNSPLLRGVFLGLPQFTQYVNIEIVWDLINVMREYLKLELEEEQIATIDGKQQTVPRQITSLSNILTGLLCSFQIIDIGAGTAFGVEEKDFIDPLYTVIMKLFENPRSYEITDYLALLKCLTIVFLQRRQYSNNLVNAFVKRLALISIHLPAVEQTGILYMIKQMITKYPQAKSALLETDSEGLQNAFSVQTYRPDLNDPQLSNASQSSIVLELIQVIEQWKGKGDVPSVKMAKSIINNEQMPQEFLGLHAIQVVKKLKQKEMK